MRFFHISDLHIGKQLYSYSLLPDQRAVLHEITERAKEYHPDTILIAGMSSSRSFPTSRPGFRCFSSRETTTRRRG